jgi:hypothetical protein
VSATALADDNILAASTKPQSDLIWSLRPALLALAGDRLAMTEHQLNYRGVIGFTPDTFIVSSRENWPGKTVMLDYGPRFNWFTTHSENDSIDQVLTFNALWPMSKLILGLRQGYSQVNSIVIEAGQRTEVQTIPTDLMSAYQVSEKSSAEMNLHRVSYDYGRTQGLNGYTDWNTDAWFNHQTTPLLNLGAGVKLGLFEVPSQKGQTYEQFLVRARYTLAERLMLIASAGLQLRQFESGAPSSAVPVFSLTAYYRPLDRTSFSLTAYRTESASVYYGVNYLQTGASLSARQQLGDRFWLNLSFDYTMLDYHTTTQTGSGTLAARTDDYLLARLGLEARFTRHLQGQLFYQYRMMSSQQWAGWSNNQIGLSATYTF